MSSDCGICCWFCCTALYGGSFETGDPLVWESAVDDPCDST